MSRSLLNFSPNECSCSRFPKFEEVEIDSGSCQNIGSFNYVFTHVSLTSLQMSLLDTKSWNPRSAKNRARVERDEAELNAESQKKGDRARQSEAEWRYDRLKSTSLTAAASVAEDKPSDGNGKPKWSEYEPSDSFVDPGPQSDKTQTAALEMHGTPFGGSRGHQKSWYEYEEYETPTKKNTTILDARFAHQSDPLTTMPEGEIRSKMMTSSKSSDRPSKSRSSPLDGVEGELTLIEKLRRERLRREQEEKQKASKLLGKRDESFRKPGPVRYGALRGDD